MMNVFRWGLLALLGVLLAGCGNDETAVGPVKMPAKESTWVETEKVKTTREEVLTGARKVLSEISIDEKLAQKLRASGSSGGKVVDHDTCMERIGVLDRKRTAVQKNGGVWAAFERHPELRPYSANGVQLDSNLNKMIFALNHLCETAKGVPLDTLTETVVKQIDQKGKEALNEKLVGLGNPPADAKKWIDYAEYARGNQAREVPYESIEKLIGRADPLVGLYEELSQRGVDDQSLPGFLSDTVTLLHVIKEILDSDPNVIMAMKEDQAVPYTESRRGGGM